MQFLSQFRSLNTAARIFEVPGFFNLNEYIPQDGGVPSASQVYGLQRLQLPKQNARYQTRQWVNWRGCNKLFLRYTWPLGWCLRCYVSTAQLERHVGQFACFGLV